MVGVFRVCRGMCVFAGSNLGKGVMNCCGFAINGVFLRNGEKCSMDLLVFFVWVWVWSLGCKLYSGFVLFKVSVSVLICGILLVLFGVKYGCCIGCLRNKKDASFEVSV